jgi:hypothetical protein
MLALPIMAFDTTINFSYGREAHFKLSGRRLGNITASGKTDVEPANLRVTPDPGATADNRDVLDLLLVYREEVVRLMQISSRRVRPHPR